MDLAREPLLKDIERRLDALSRSIKDRARNGLNDGAKFLEPFAARLLNAAYGWALQDPASGVPNTKGLDLRDDTNRVAVQVTIQESADKIKHTRDMFSDEEFAEFNIVAVFFLHRIEHRNDHGLRIINIRTLLGHLQSSDPSVLREIIAILDDEIAIHQPTDPARADRLRTYLEGLVTGFQGYNEIGIEHGKEGEDESPPIWKIFVPPVCTPDRAISPAEMESAQNASPPTTPAVPLLPLLADSQNRRHVLLGDPGMGKSTLIQRLTAGLASGQSTPDAPALDSCLPIPLILRDIVPHLPDDPSEWNWSTLCDTMRRKYQRSEDTPAIYSPWPNLRSLREELFNNPNAFFLIDGLDEIGDTAKRIAIRDAIWEGFRAHPDARWLVTSRIVGYDLAKADHDTVTLLPKSPFTADQATDQACSHFRKIWGSIQDLSTTAVLNIESGPVRRSGAAAIMSVATLLYLAPFDNTQQDLFVKNWFRERKAPNPPPGLLGDIRSREHEGIRVLARVPNLLSYMAILKRDGKPLPDGRADLYMAIARAYLHGIDRAYRLSKKHGHDCPIPFADRLRLLAILAGEMQHHRAAEVAAWETWEESENEKGRIPEPKPEGHIIIAESEVRALLAIPLARMLPGCDVDKELHDFLSFIVSRSGLLLDRGTGTDGHTLFGFTHLSFLEFFAACYLREELTHENDMLLAAVSSGDDPEDVAFQAAYLADYPRGPRPILRRDLAAFAARAEWHEALIFLAELHASNERQRDTLLRQLFPALHSKDPVPVRESPNDAYIALLPLEAARLAIILARDQHLNLAPRIRREWLVRLWDAFLAQFKRNWPTEVWPVSRYLLDGPTAATDALAAMREAAANHQDLEGIDLSACLGLTGIEFIADLWPDLRTLLVRNCSNLTNADELPAGLVRLSLSGCSNLSSADHLPVSVKTLILDGCVGLTSVSNLPANLMQLSLGTCTGLRVVDSWPPKLESLDLSGCTSLTTVGTLPASLKMLWLHDCPGLSADEMVARIRQELPRCAIYGY